MSSRKITLSPHTIVTVTSTGDTSDTGDPLFAVTDFYGTLNELKTLVTQIEHLIKTAGESPGIQLPRRHDEICVG